MALSQGAPRRRRVDRRLPALSSLRGHRPAQERRCAALANRPMSVPISDRMTWALSSLTPWDSTQLFDSVAKAGKPSIGLPVDLGNGGIERVDLLQMQSKQKTMVTFNASMQRF